MKRLLVTGGGFIGSHLCAKLLDAGHEVLCVDNFFTGRRRNILPLLDNKNFDQTSWRIGIVLRQALIVA